MGERGSIAVLGTGIMGEPMARNLARGGFEVRAWNRTRAKAEPLAADGVTVADSPADAARGADFVLTMLTDGSVVEAAMTGDAGALAAMEADAVWLQCSTVGIDATERLVGLASTAGIAFVDAPVLGTRKPAEDATLAVLASGPADLEARCSAVFDLVGSNIAWVGPAGIGSRLKLVMNTWVLSLTAAVAESVALAEGLGLDPSLFLSTLQGGAMDSPYAHIKGRAMMARDFPPAFLVTGAVKDTGLILDAARSCGVSADVVAAVREKFERAAAMGHGGEDMGAIYYAAAPQP